MNRTWTDDEEQYLVAHYATTSNAELAAALGKKNADRVMAKASLLGLKKSSEFLRESCKARTKGQFKKGSIPHNKGKKLSEEMKAKLAKTMFKSGNRPHNTLEVGAETQDKDGYVMVKIAEPNVWKLKHHIAYGEPVPTGHKLIFIDGNKYNFERENLKLISDADLMRLNTMHRFPPDLVRVIKTINKLQRKIKNGAESCAI